MRRKHKGGYAYCSQCKKELYRSRKEARKAARAVHPDKVLNAYTCLHLPGWHYGNLPIGGRESARHIQKVKVDVEP